MWFDITVFIFTDLASVYTLYGICAALALHAAWRGHTAVALSIVVVSIACGLSIIGLKEWFAVARPPNPLIVVDTYAFPSGHAAGVIFLGGLLWLYNKYLYTITHSPIWLVSLVGLVTAVGLSRIWFQVHTAEQVLAGYVVGAFWTLILYWWWQNIQQK